MSDLTAAGPAPLTRLEQLKALRGSTSPNDEWLRTLYESYSARLIANNERIWATGAILIPLSLSAFAALVVVEKPAPWKTVLLGVASTGMILLWNLIAESHRSAQQYAQEYLDDIEKLLGLPDRPPGTGFIRRVRWAVAIVVFLAWSVLSIAHRAKAGAW